MEGGLEAKEVLAALLKRRGRGRGAARGGGEGGKEGRPPRGIGSPEWKENCHYEARTAAQDL